MAITFDDFEHAGRRLPPRMRREADGTWSARVSFGREIVGRQYGFSTRAAAREADVSVLPDGCWMRGGEV